MLLSQVQPRKLPRHEPAPIAVFLSGHVDSVSRGVPPQLRGLEIEVNRHGKIDSAMGQPIGGPDVVTGTKRIRDVRRS